MTDRVPTWSPVGTVSSQPGASCGHSSRASTCAPPCGVSARSRGFVRSWPVPSMPTPARGGPGRSHLGLGLGRGCRRMQLRPAVASPMIATRRPEEVIRPAVEGVHRSSRSPRRWRTAGRLHLQLRCDLLRAPSTAEPFDETSWTNLEASNMSLYVRSKTLAERAAWDFIAVEVARWSW